MVRGKNIAVLLLTLLAILLASGCLADDSVSQTQKPPTTKDSSPAEKISFEIAVATRVIDGDTIEVTFADGTKRKVRYIGINTPERFEDLYKESTQANARLVEGKEVKLVKDVSETDKYGRLLRYVYIGDTFVNAELVKRGYAAVATYPPDVKYADYFVKLAAEAREKKVGLWSDNSESAPPTTINNPDKKLQETGPYIGNQGTKKFHLPSCNNLPASKNQVLFGNRDEALNSGYVPCKSCNP